MTLLHIQLITSFLAGGIIIALLGLIAEKASEKTAGIIISFPTTIAIGFFFVGWATSPQAVADVAPIIPAMEGVVMIFTTVYLYLSKIRLSKFASLSLCTFGSLLAWAGLAFPLAVTNFNNFFVSVVIYIILTGISYYLITLRTHEKINENPTIKYTYKEKFYRALFAGLVMALAVYLSKTLGTVWGIVFSAFPAVYISTMTILLKKHNSAFLFRVWKNSPVGSLVFVIFAVVAMYAFPEFGLFWGTLISYIISGLAMYWLMKANFTNIRN